MSAPGKNGKNRHPVVKRKRGPEKGNGGRKSKCTPELIARVEKLARLGLSQNRIAALLDVSPITLCMWKRDGRQNYIDAVKRGEAQGVEDRLARINKAGEKGNWTADAWTLERRFPEEFSRRVDVTGMDNATPQRMLIVKVVDVPVPEQRRIKDAETTQTIEVKVEPAPSAAANPEG